MNQTRTKISPFTCTLDTREHHWFALMVRPRTEKMVAQSLRRKGIEAYVPVLTKYQYYTRKVKKVELPLIRGYVLVPLILADYIKALDTEHVCGFIKHNKAPAIIPDEQIELIRRVEGTGKCADAVPVEQLEPGAHLEVIGGDLTGMSGRLVRLKGKDFVSVELIYMDTALILDIDKKYLRLI
jgi:transcriptional antiterminator RfaH